MLRKKTVLLLLFCCLALQAVGVFEVEKNASGTFLVKHRGEVLLRDIAALVAEDGVAISLKSDEKLLPDGTKVWNVWSEEYESRYRMEVVLPHDGGSVEISLLGEAPAWPKYSKRQLRMSLPLERLTWATGSFPRKAAWSMVRASY